MTKRLTPRKAGLPRRGSRPIPATLASHGGEGRIRESGSYRTDDSPLPRGQGFDEGSPSALPFDLADIVRREVERASRGDRAEIAILDDLLAHGFSRDELFDLVVPRRTFARRRLANDLLSQEESDRAVRLARLTAMAERIFGEAERAHRWLRKPSRTLDGVVPLTLMKTETGAHLVEQTLHRIDYGMLA